MTASEHRAERVRALARVRKMRRQGLVGGVDNVAGSITLWREDPDGEVGPTWSISKRLTPVTEQPR